MESDKLGTMQRNALCQFFGRKEFTPQEVARFDYAEIERLPKIGKKGIKVIRCWLQACGYDLCNLPEDKNHFGERQLHNRLQHATKLLVKHGYRVEPP